MGLRGVSFSAEPERVAAERGERRGGERRTEEGMCDWPGLVGPARSIAERPSRAGQETAPPRTSAERFCSCDTCEEE